jgi:hypothetical protein
MIKNLQDNPILAYQMSNAEWPTLRTAVWFAVALTVIGVALAVISMGLAMMFYSVVPLIAVFGPLVTTITAAMSPVQAIDLERKGEISLSELFDRDMVRGYIACMLFQMRSLWMVAGGLALPFAAAFARVNAFFASYVECLEFPIQPGRVCPPPLSPEVYMEYVQGALFFTFLLVILFIVWNWLAITLGVWMAFRFQNRDNTWGAILALLPVALVIVPNIAMAVNGSSFEQLLPIFLASVMLSVMLSWLAYRQAVKCVRNMRQ